MKIKDDIDKNVIVNYTAVIALVLLIFVIAFSFFKYGCQSKKNVPLKEDSPQDEIAKSNNKEKEPLNLEIMGAIIVDIDDLRLEVKGVVKSFIKNDIVMPTAKKKIESIKNTRFEYIKYLEENNYNGKLKEVLENENNIDDKIIELISNADRGGLEKFAEEKSVKD